MPNNAQASHHVRSLALSHALVGKKVVEARYMFDEEMVQMGWDPAYNDPGIVILMHDNTQLIVQQDPEGNGPGRVLLTNPQDQTDVL